MDQFTQGYQDVMTQYKPETADSANLKAIPKSGNKRKCSKPKKNKATVKKNVVKNPTKKPRKVKLKIALSDEVKLELQNEAVLNDSEAGVNGNEALDLEGEYKEELDSTSDQDFGEKTGFHTCTCRLVNFHVKCLAMVKKTEIHLKMHCCC